MSETQGEYSAGKRKAVKAVEIRAEIRQIKTMADHTINVTINLPEDCLPQAQILLGWQGDEVRAIIENVTNG